MRTTDFDGFVAARSGSLLRTAYLLTHDHALAEDLLQTSLTKAWFAWSRIEERPEPYVRKILVNTYSSWRGRKWHGEQAHDQLPEPPGRRPGVDAAQQQASQCDEAGCPGASGPSSSCATTRT